MEQIRSDVRFNRQALIDAAWILVSKEGPTVSLRAIAKEANVGIATMYRHFGNRGELIAGLAEEINQRVTLVVQEAVTTWSKNPKKAWNEFAQSMAGLQIGVLATQLTEAVTDFSQLPKSFKVTRAKTITAVDSVLKLAKEQRFVKRDLDPLQFQAGIGSLSRPLPKSIAKQLPGFSDWLLETYLRGLRPDN